MTIMLLRSLAACTRPLGHMKTSDLDNHKYLIKEGMQYVKSITFLLVLFSINCAIAQTRSEPYKFEVEIKKEIEAEKFEILVPENRSDSQSRMISLSFIKLESRAVKPGSPIIYLAGGPGGSGTSAMKGQRWIMFDRLRDIADVIILDQRGTGLSSPLPRCQASRSIPADSATSRQNVLRWHEEAAKECLDYWKKEGIDLKGYTTWESAGDIEAVRKALEVDQVSLLGISYGTHLALATLKRYPESIDRLVLASAEGLDQTVKLPSRTDAYFDRLQAVINADPEAKARFPDIKKLIRGVLDSVESNPIYMQVDDDPEFYHTLGKFEIQRITSYMIADPAYVPSLLNGYLEASKGNFNWFKNYLDWYIRDNSISFNGMALAMDLASGVSDERLKQVNKEAETALLGDATNFPMPHLRGVIDGIDLGDDFRDSFKSDRPILFISGTLDGRTYPEAHKDLAQKFTNSEILTIENAGHNLFFSHEELIESIGDFFEGGSFEIHDLKAPLPNFSSN